MPPSTAAQLPSELVSSLETFSDALASALGPDLESLVVYGPAAGGDYVPDLTAVNVLIVPRQATVSVLKQLVPPLREARRTCRLVPFVMTRSDLIASSDVFPIKFRMMKECHVVLRGDDVLEGVEVADTHLRLRCEQELKNLVLRLRLRFLEAQGDVARLRNVAIMTSQAAIDPLRVLVGMKCGTVPPRNELVRTARETCGLELSEFDRVKQTLGTTNPKMDELEGAYERLMSTITAAAAYADRL